VTIQTCIVAVCRTASTNYSLENVLQTEERCVSWKTILITAAYSATSWLLLTTTKIFYVSWKRLVINQLKFSQAKRQPSSSLDLRCLREADNINMMSMWRINMVRFWNGHHYKCLRVGHWLLAGINFVSCATSLNLQGLEVILGPTERKTGWCLWCNTRCRLPAQRLWHRSWR